MEYENETWSGFRVHNSWCFHTLHWGNKTQMRREACSAKLKSDLIQAVMYVWSNFANLVTKFRPSNQLRLMNDAVNQKS